MRPNALSRIPRESKVAAAVLAVALLQVVLLASLGIGQAERRRDDAERDIALRADRAVRSLVVAARRGVAEHEERVRAETDRADLGAAERAAAALRRAPLFAAAHLIDRRGEAVDAARTPFPVPETSLDLDARRRVERLLAEEASDPQGAPARAAALADEILRAPRPDRVAAALALQSGARAALRTDALQAAIDLSRRVLETARPLRDDRAVEGESEPFGPSASHVQCEALLRALPTGGDDVQSAFVDAVTDRRAGAQRLRGTLSEIGFAVERDECRRLRREATALRIEFQRRLDANLRECDAADAALAAIRAAPRPTILGAIGRGEPERLALADGSLVLVLPGPRAEPWAAFAFTAPAAALERTVSADEIAAAGAPDGVTVAVRDARGRVVAGGPVPSGDAPVLATSAIGPALPGLEAVAWLADAAVVDREADAARRWSLWVLAAAILAVVAASLLAVRAVTREVRLARLKSDFASNLSHELRTPLTSLRMFVDTLREGRVRDEAEAKECLDVIAQESDRLSSLVERILQFASFSRGRAPIELRSADAGEVVRRAVVLFRRRAEAAGARLDLHVEDSLPESILDRDAVAQVVLNLLDNAVKHSGEKEAKVRVTVRPHPPGGGQGVAILVEDGGPGVPERERDLVFEEFYRGDDTLSRRTQGAGLGLALSKRIVLAHGGTIDVVRSADLGGACFRVVLPDAARGRGLAVAAQHGGSR